MDKLSQWAQEKKAKSVRRLAKLDQQAAEIEMERAVLWLAIASAGFASLPEGVDGLARLEWDHLSDPSDPDRSSHAIAHCPAGSFFSFESFVEPYISPNGRGYCVSTSRPDGALIWEMPERYKEIPGSPWSAIEPALHMAKEGLDGLLSFSVDLLEKAQAKSSFHSRVFVVSGQNLLEPASFARAMNMPSLAAFYEARQLDESTLVAPSTRPKTL